MEDRGGMRLSEVVRERMLRKGMARRTIEAYVSWILRYVGFQRRQHPRELGAVHMERFLSHLAVERNVASATQNQALAALFFLYRDVLEVRVPWLDGVVRAKKPARLPQVLSVSEVRAVLDHVVVDRDRLVAQLLYGSGLRLLEALRLRVQEVDLERGRLMVRQGKGGKDRVTILPASLIPAMRHQMDQTLQIHREDVAAGFGAVWLPHALRVKYPNAACEPGWQVVFPASRRSVDPESQQVRRHHLDERVIQHAVRNAVQAAGVIRPASCQSRGRLRMPRFTPIRDARNVFQQRTHEPAQAAQPLTPHRDALG